MLKGFRLATMEERQMTRMSNALSGESYSQMMTRLGSGTVEAIAFMGDGTKTHAVEMRFITVNGEQVVVSVSPMCNTYARFSGVPFAEMGKIEINCSKCAKKMQTK